MKRLMAMTVAVIMTGALCACGSTDESSKEDKSSMLSSSISEVESEVSKELSKEFNVEIHNSAEAPLGETDITEADVDTTIMDKYKGVESEESYVMDMEIIMSGDGVSMDMPMLMVKDGDNSYTSASMFGFEATALVLDGKQYNIDVSNKVYYISEVNAEDGLTVSEDASEVSDMLNSESTGAANVKINGEEFYRIGVKEEDTDYTTYIYFYDNELKYMAYYSSGEESSDISSNAGGALIKINALGNDIEEYREKYMVIPEDYKEVTEDEYSEMMMNSMSFEVNESGIEGTEE